MRITTPWIYSAKFDSAAIIGPPVAITAVVLILGNKLATISAPLWLWILLVIGVDVSHVYSSLFRTYLDKEEFRSRKMLYIFTPIYCWLIGALIYWQLGDGFFWSCVAYFAIYHFIRQQYGFFMLYRRGEPRDTVGLRIDQIAIYLATIYPMVYWHTYGRNFQWFDKFEVVRIPSVWPELICLGLYVGIFAAFIIKEAIRYRKTSEFNPGKSALLFATAAAWGTGIIVFNGDLTFTLVNIISHGIPYMALVWVYQYQKKGKTEHVGNRFLRFFQLKYIPFYILALFGLAFFEEGIWDWFVWKEHGQLFGNFFHAPANWILVLLVPLLTMPQVTHYVLDAYIWRLNKKGQQTVRAVIG